MDSLIGTGILVAIVGVLAEIVRRMRSDLALVNDAVNHRHKRTDQNGETPPKLYDLAIENHQEIKALHTTVKTDRETILERLDRHSDSIKEHGARIEEIKINLRERGVCDEAIEKAIERYAKRKEDRNG